ncbi:MAG: hypothetical protein CME34_08420 [Gordonia sp.]|nr:hypothetical protein [Gordonia sp. (in: high G+C Gram-positive bacteria)]
MTEPSGLFVPPPRTGGRSGDQWPTHKAKRRQPRRPSRRRENQSRPWWEIDDYSSKPLPSRRHRKVLDAVRETQAPGAAGVSTQGTVGGTRGTRNLVAPTSASSCANDARNLAVPAAASDFRNVAHTHEPADSDSRRDHRVTTHHLTSENDAGIGSAIRRSSGQDGDQ